MLDTVEQLQALGRRVASLERLVGKTLDVVCRAEAAVERATEAITARQAAEAAHLRVRGIEVVNAAGEPMVSIRASESGGSVLIRAGSGQEAAALGVDENSCGLLAVQDPASLALAGLQIRNGRGELMTMAADCQTCAVGPGRPTKNS